MPFQGNVNAGAVDPGLIKMLFDQKARREEIAYRQQIDQAEAARQAMLDSKEQARKDELHRLAVFEKRLAVSKGAKEMGSSLAPNLDLALDENAAPSDRQAGGASYIQGLQESAQLAAGFDPAGNPNQITGDILNRLGNEAAASAGLRRAEARSNPTLDWEYDSAGNKRRSIVGEGGRMTPVPGASWVPPRSGVTVNVGGGELDLKQIADVSARESQTFQEKIAPFEANENALSGLESFRSMADENGMLPYEASQFVASDVMASMRGEALNEGDVKRLASVGLMNTAKEWVGIPARMSVSQADTLAQILSERAKSKEGKRRRLIRNGIYRAEKFQIDPKLVVGDYADEAVSWNDEKSDGAGKTPPDAGRIPSMTASDKARIEKQLRKAMRIPGSSEVPATMVLDAWKAENGQRKVVE